MDEKPPKKPTKEEAAAKARKKKWISGTVAVVIGAIGAFFTFGRKRPKT